MGVIKPVCRQWTYATLAMRRTTCVVMIVCLLIVSKGRLLSKRQTTSCPPNCFQCDGGTCRSCNSGWYGQDCSKSCSSCPGGCSQDSGNCLCPDGTFGLLCREKCPVKCRSDSKGIVTCSKTNGHCDSGCKGGYHGIMCNLTCGHCTDVTCDQTTGNCTSACAERWGGPTCSISCITNCVSCSDSLFCNKCSGGYYGRQCTGTSSISSVEQTTTSTFTTTYAFKVSGPSAATVGIIVGVALGVITVIFLVLVLIYLKRTKRTQRPNTCREYLCMCKRDEDIFYDCKTPEELEASEQAMKLTTMTADCKNPEELEASEQASEEAMKFTTMTADCKNPEELEASEEAMKFTTMTADCKTHEELEASEEAMKFTQ